MAATVKQGVLKLKPERAQRVASVLSILVALCWGLFTGLLVCVPAGYYYRFWRDSKPLRGDADYARSKIAAINADWDLFQRIQRQNALLGDRSPAGRLAPQMRLRLMQAADGIIESYRNSSDPVLRDFDWPKAAVCLGHVLELDRSDGTARGKLALVDGYINLIRADSVQGDARAATIRAAEANFQEAAGLMPRSPDPHLGLARIYIYSLKNIGKAMAEMHEAAGVGFRPGPRELEEEADGYRFRAGAELAEARRLHGGSRAAADRYLRMAERDFERARQLYEPIQGFSNVSVALREVDEDDRARQALNDAWKKPPARRPRRYSGRVARWQ